MLDVESYDKYVANAKPGSKPWLLMFMSTPLGSSQPSYQVNEMMMARMICASRALNFNLGFIDNHNRERISESFNFRLYGGNGMQVPYYVYTKDGQAYHLQQQIFSAIKFVKAIDEINNEKKAWHVEALRPSRGDWSIYWEYAKREAGQS